MRNTRRTARAIMAAGTALGLIALAGCSGASGDRDANTIRVVYNVPGDQSPLDDIMKQVKTEYEAANEGMTVELVPIESTQNDYFTKLALMNKSTATAPDVIYEDSYMVKPDSDAGYLAPLDDYVADWPDWAQVPEAARGAGTGEDGKIYGISMGTDTQAIWYNKEVLVEAGLPEDWQPKTWEDMLDAARAIKEQVPDVVPWTIYGGTQLGEAGSVRGFQTFLAGTGDSLYNPDTKKWVLGSQGFLDALTLVQTVYSEGLGPDASTAADPNLTNTVAQDWLPQGKVGFVIDGSWLPRNWIENGPTPLDGWAEKLGWAAIPTQRGDGAGITSMSGGWTIAMGANATDPDAAWDFIATLLSKENTTAYDIAASQIAVRDDVAADADYQNANPAVPFFTELVKVTNFRPSTSDYEQISYQISIATEAVITGQSSPEDAQAAYDAAVTGIVGEDNTEQAK